MRWSGEGGERGQATVEWIGLVLGLALAFGGALSVARGADFGGEADELGEALAKRMTCGVRGACGPRGGRPRVGGRPLRARPSAPPGAFAGRGTPPWAPLGQRPGRLKGVGPRVLRALGRAGRFAWPLCLGLHRLRYDLDHPRTPRQGIPLRDTLGLLNKCVNPWAFLVP
jgi:hypothetical protein